LGALRGGVEVCRRNRRGKHLPVRSQLFLVSVAAMRPVVRLLTHLPTFFSCVALLQGLTVPASSTAKNLIILKSYVSMRLELKGESKQCQGLAELWLQLRCNDGAVRWPSSQTACRPSSAAPPQGGMRAWSLLDSCAAWHSRTHGTHLWTPVENDSIDDPHFVRCCCSV